MTTQRADDGVTGLADAVGKVDVHQNCSVVSRAYF